MSIVEELTYLLDTHKYEYGNCITREGEHGKSVFFVASGSI